MALVFAWGGRGENERFAGGVVEETSLGESHPLLGAVVKSVIDDETTRMELTENTGRRVEQEHVWQGGGDWNGRWDWGLWRVGGGRGRHFS